MGAMHYFFSFVTRYPPTLMVRLFSCLQTLWCAADLVMYKKKGEAGR